MYWPISGNLCYHFIQLDGWNNRPESNRSECFTFWHQVTEPHAPPKYFKYKHIANILIIQFWVNRTEPRFYQLFSSSNSEYYYIENELLSNENRFPSGVHFLFCFLRVKKSKTQNFVMENFYWTAQKSLKCWCLLTDWQRIVASALQR